MGFEVPPLNSPESKGQYTSRTGLLPTDFKLPCWPPADSLPASSNPVSHSCSMELPSFLAAIVPSQPWLVAVMSGIIAFMVYEIIKALTSRKPVVAEYKPRQVTCVGHAHMPGVPRQSLPAGPLLE